MASAIRWVLSDADGMLQQMPGDRQQQIELPHSNGQDKPATHCVAGQQPPKH